MTDSLSSELALSIIENCPFAILITDIDDKVVSYNRTFERLVGRTQADDLVGRAYREMGDHPLRLLLAGENTLCWTDRNAKQHQFEVQSIELPEQNNCRARLFVDISRQVELQRSHDALNEELKRHVLTDDSTGLLNKRGVALALEPQVARSRRYNSPISIIMMDVNLTENIEAARLQIARLLKDQLRWADLIGCSDNGEFILVLPETTPEASLQLAEKLKQKLHEMADQALDGQSIEACYGVTGWRRSDNADTLLSRAGMALSKAQSEQGEYLIAL